MYEVVGLHLRFHKSSGVFFVLFFFSPQFELGNEKEQLVCR